MHFQGVVGCVLRATAKLKRKKKKKTSHLTPQTIGVWQNFSEWKAEERKYPRTNKLWAFHIRSEASMTDVRVWHQQDKQRSTITSLPLVSPPVDQYGIFSFKISPVTQLCHLNTAAKMHQLESKDSMRWDVSYPTLKRPSLPRSQPCVGACCSLLYNNFQELKLIIALKAIHLLLLPSILMIFILHQIV